jgi:hypothetical protein
MSASHTMRTTGERSICRLHGNGVRFEALIAYYEDDRGEIDLLVARQMAPAFEEPAHGPCASE